jgi:hypothetical protein
MKTATIAFVGLKKTRQLLIEFVKPFPLLTREV